jgi:hypothetical protein
VRFALLAAGWRSPGSRLARLRLQTATGTNAADGGRRRRAGRDRAGACHGPAAGRQMAAPDAPGGGGGLIPVDIDATVLAAHSERPRLPE